MWLCLCRVRMSGVYNRRSWRSSLQLRPILTRPDLSPPHRPCDRFYTHAEAVDCMRLVSGTKLDERIIRCDLDPGYKEGRQYGRGRSGGQVRDEYRQEFDAGRGGWGHNRLREEEERKRAEELEAKRRREHEEVYQSQEAEQGGRIVPTGAEGVYLENEAYERAGAPQQSTIAAAAGAPGGTKRARDDDDSNGEAQYAAESNKNPRFREEREEDDE